jgi:hypothetical protein
MRFLKALWRGSRAAIQDACWRLRRQPQRSREECLDVLRGARSSWVDWCILLGVGFAGPLLFRAQPILVPFFFLVIALLMHLDRMQTQLTALRDLILSQAAEESKPPRGRSYEAVS